MKSSFYRQTVVTAIVLAALTLGVAIFSTVSVLMVVGANSNTLWFTVSLLVWSLLLLGTLILSYRDERVSLLAAGFCAVVVLRISDLNHLLIVFFPILLICLCILLAFYVVAQQNGRTPTGRKKGTFSLSPDAWHVSFFRVYLGYDMIAHFGEKLFAGPVSYFADVKAFTALGVPHPEVFVLLAGLCEVIGAISLSLGFMTRIGALFTGLYLLIATALGEHFTVGFIWALPGGGWEYPVMWTIFVLTFAWRGAGTYSADHVLKSHHHLPKWIRFLMGN